MVLKENNTLQKFLEVDLRSLNDIDVANAMYFCYYNNTYNKKGIISSIFRILIYLCTIDISYTVHDSGRIAFLYSNSYKGRKDFLEIMNKISDMFSSKIMFLPGKRKISLKGLKYSYNVFCWIQNLKKVFPKNEAIYYASMILFAKRNSDTIVDVAVKNNCQCMVVLSDMHLIDSFVVQQCNHKGITTATLQHGNFEGIEPFVLSRSKYFIAHGEYAKEKAEKCGIPASRIREAGLLKLIGKQIPDAIQRRHNKVFSVGVILSGDMFGDADTRMISMLSDYCKQRELEISVKCHPNFGPEFYQGIDWSLISNIYTNEINVEEFSRRVDIAIVLNTTVFLEYVLMLIPTFIYIDYEDNFMPNIHWCKFQNAEELDQLLSLFEKNPELLEKNMKETRKYFSCTEDISQQYHDVIEEISRS